MFSRDTGPLEKKKKKDGRLAVNTNEGLESMTRASESATSIPSSVYRQVSDLLVTPRVLIGQHDGKNYVKRTNTILSQAGILLRDREVVVTNMAPRAERCLHVAADQLLQSWQLH